jgi:hypothetical protein
MAILGHCDYWAKYNKAAIRIGPEEAWMCVSPQIGGLGGKGGVA